MRLHDVKNDRVKALDVVAADGKAALARVSVPILPVTPAGKFEGKVNKEFEKQSGKFKRLAAERDATAKAASAEPAAAANSAKA
ncbi:hypothetical protein T492DRAFT_866391, partial [Pavlovales sp. CCMP2436]